MPFKDNSSSNFLARGKTAVQINGLMATKAPTERNTFGPSVRARSAGRPMRLPRLFSQPKEPKKLTMLSSSVASLVKKNSTASGPFPWGTTASDLNGQTATKTACTPFSSCGKCVRLRLPLRRKLRNWSLHPPMNVITSTSHTPPWEYQLVFHPTPGFVAQAAEDKPSLTANQLRRPVLRACVPIGWRTRCSFLADSRGAIYTLE